MYKKTLLTLFLSAYALGTSAQVKPTSKKATTAKTVPVEAAKPAPVEEAKPTGPVGFGPVKIYMSKEELEALTASDSAYWPPR